MPQIIVIADTPTPDGAECVLLRERVTERLFESGHFAKQLVERLGWAVEDAHAVDRLTETDLVLGRSGDVEANATAATDEADEAASGQRRSARVVTTAS